MKLLILIEGVVNRQSWNWISQTYPDFPTIYIGFLFVQVVPHFFQIPPSPPPNPLEPIFCFWVLKNQRGILGKKKVFLCCIPNSNCLLCLEDLAIHSWPLFWLGRGLGREGDGVSVCVWGGGGRWGTFFSGNVYFGLYLGCMPSFNILWCLELVKKFVWGPVH